MKGGRGPWTVNYNGIQTWKHIILFCVILLNFVLLLISKLVPSIKTFQPIKLIYKAESMFYTSLFTSGVLDSKDTNFD